MVRSVCSIHDEKTWAAKALAAAMLHSSSTCQHTSCWVCCRPWTTFLPLGIVLGAAMIKEAVEDYRRHKQDIEVNNRKVQVCRSGTVAKARPNC